MSSRGLATACCFLVVALAGLLVLSRPAFAVPQSTGWLYDAIDRLKTLGVMPLWAGTVRPIPSTHLRAAVEEAMKRAEQRPLSDADRALLDRLKAASGLNSVTLTTGPTAFALSRPAFFMGGQTSRVEWLLGSSLDEVSTAGAFTELGQVGIFLGRSPIGWGPIRDGALLFSEHGPGVDRLQAFVQWRSLRLTKVIAPLDGGRSMVATRLDLRMGRTFRIGLAESIIMAGGPWWPYIVNPMPLLMSQYLEQLLRPASGDNQLESADAEWVVHPGLRLFGEIMFDDFTNPTPTANFPSRVGLSLGIHRAFDAGGDVQVTYTAVSNWTYTQTPGDYVLRGMPLAHPLGNDFDVLHVRWIRSPSAPALWASVIRKGEGRIGVTPVSDTQAQQLFFLSGVVEQSVVLGTDLPFGTGDGWQGTIGPWLAYRSNAGHVAGATRIDWGISLSAGRTF